MILALRRPLVFRALWTRHITIHKGPKRDINKAKSPSRTSLKLSSRFDKRKAKQAQKHKSKDQFKYGEFGGLKENKNENLTSNSNLIEKIKSFEELKLLPEVRTHIIDLIKKDSLSTDVSEITPSPIQVVAIKRLSKNLMDNKLQVHAIAAETGSGKTMAYAAPLFDYLKRQEMETPEFWETIKDKAIVRSVILVPTIELIDQVHATLSSSNDDVFGLNVKKWNNDVSYQELLEALKNRIDILITTPSKLLAIQKIRMISRPDLVLQRVNFAVFDEADTLLDRSWLEDTHRALKAIPNVNHLILCSATIPNEFNKTLTKMFPNIVPLTTPRLHKLPKGLNFKIVNAAISPYKGSKIKALAQTLYAIAHDGTDVGYEKRSIVFVNEKKDVEPVVNKLRDQYGHNVVGLTGSMDATARQTVIKPFISPPEPITQSQSIKQENLRDQETLKLAESNITIGDINSIVEPIRDGNDASPLRVLVTTDVMARGINFKGVRNVVLYDVPSTTIDLVHRSGRTARMRQTGRVFMIIDRKTKSWAKAIPSVLKNNKALT
ncbi:ATP-dependent RNA helicase MRH4, mitochondrial [Nakaseomyces bracarensis]|uniref:ATP-dependent RNA helicase MRH4, mitochondrial n=1 Tax=Nakaseomyces bracarensis TaxID=273131 RepID=A0ABR4NM86_9SACH